MTDLKISGYASLFNIADLSGDVVKYGAFDHSLKNIERLPLLWSHETRDPVGVWDKLYVNNIGLYVEGRILTEDSNSALRTVRLIQEGAVTGLSIGYRAEEIKFRKSGGRKLLKLDLWEVSIVTFPMLQKARIDRITEI